MEQIEYLGLSNLGHGAAEEKFNEVLKRVIENINDPNTDWKKAREIHIKVSIAPNEGLPYG